MLLVKPQFEAGKVEADRGRGVQTRPSVALGARGGRGPPAGRGAAIIGWMVSPVRGAKGNVEFFVHAALLLQWRRHSRSLRSTTSLPRRAFYEHGDARRAQPARQRAPARGEAVEWLYGLGHEVRLPLVDAEAVGHPELGVSDAKLAQGSTLAVSLGGDGTMLRTVDPLDGRRVPCSA